MSNVYKVNVDKTFQFDISNDDVLKVDTLKINDSNYHVLEQNKPYQIEVIQADFLEKQYTLRVNNTIYKVDISNALDVLIKDMGFSLGSVKHINIIKAPMPGLLLDINVKVGQEVKEDDALLILEAMKMENIITSPRDGIIKSVAVNKGDAIDKGQLLIEFE